ncbi:hypothetical protein DPMN_031050 [Dreissena polymorpha]|uniref:Uncharacterized protein n=1 Tax=Dreissena polymorpha TaxID=45954 RepID=A0A9D4RHN8_DREPO|nr:hypothetical protein DPMN_031050 [Dreissena polymorpha]
MKEEEVQENKKEERKKKTTDKWIKLTEKENMNKRQRLDSMVTADEHTELVEVQEKIQKLMRMRRTLVAERSECTVFEEGGFLNEVQTFTRKYKI